MTAISELSKKTVSYFSDEDISIHCLCGPNPMRPLRVKLTNKLVEGYQLDRKMIMHRPRQLSFEELNMFHADGASRSLMRAFGGTVS
jgi:acetoin utilization deacetylase AcuC-like enzyme